MPTPRPDDFGGAPAAATSERSQAATVVDGVAILVIVVSVRGLLARALRGTGYRVLEAASGEHALATAGEIDGALDVLVTDVVMPGMSGLALWERLGRRRPETRVLFMSGYAEERARAHGGLPEGAVMIQKPFRPSELDRAIRELVADPYPGRSRKIGDDQARSATGARQSSPPGVRSSA